MRILITGGAGFIGSNLARLTMKHGHEVTILDDLSTGYRDNVDESAVRFIEGSVADTRVVDTALEEVDAVIHLAALGSVPRSIKDPVATHRANIDGTLTLLEAMRSKGVRQISFASSSSVYGKNPALPKSEREWVRPISPYAVSKLAGEQYVLAYQESFGFSSTAFRFFNVYGPGQRAGHAYAAVIPIFLDALAKGEPLPVNGDGTQTRDFTFVSTVCEALLDSAVRGVSAPEPVNLAFGTNTSLLELIAVIEEVTGLKATTENRPPRAGDVPHSQAANDHLRGIFPDVKPVSLTAGVDATWAWLRRNMTSNA